MPSFDSLLIVVAVAFAAPFLLGLRPSLRLPSVVLEIIAGIIVGPSLLGLAEVDEAIEVIALVGLAFVLFLAGLEIEFEKLRGPVLRLTAIAFAVLGLVDRDEVMTHPEFRRKLEAIGFGFFIPVFFVTTGVRFDLDALTASAQTLIMVPIFLTALLVVRGLPALIYRRVLDSRRTAVAGLLQATSLPFIVAASTIGVELKLVDAAERAALIGAGLLSVLVFPLAGLLALRGSNASARLTTEPQATV